jgi:hypothetical protein
MKLQEKMHFARDNLLMESWTGENYRCAMDTDIFSWPGMLMFSVLFPRKKPNEHLYYWNLFVVWIKLLFVLCGHSVKL